MRQTSSAKLPIEPLLFVDDDGKVTEVVARYLGRNGISCDVCASLEAAKRYLTERVPSAVLVDLGLPDGDGLEVLSYMNERECACPAIIISTCNEDGRQISALRAGAYDYIVKPLRLPVLLARVEAVLRAAVGKSDLTIEVDKAARIARNRTKSVQLTTAELTILLRLSQEARRPVHRNDLVRALSAHAKVATRTVDYYVFGLRRKLESIEGKGSIRTEKYGYSLYAALTTAQPDLQ